MQYQQDDKLTAKRDVYNGIEFRSKLESKTAQAFDNIGIKYEYEPQGYKLSNGLWYKPDFYLPVAHQFVECKGVMNREDCAKMYGLVEDTNKSVIAIGYNTIMMLTRFFNQPEDEVCSYTYLGIMQCKKCNGIWFMAHEDTFACPCCGEYDGDHHLKPLCHDLESGTALFEYGQYVVSNKEIYQQISDKFNDW